MEFEFQELLEAPISPEGDFTPEAKDTEADQEFDGLLRACKDDADLQARIRAKMGELEDELVNLDRQYVLEAQQYLERIDQALNGLFENE